MADSGLILTQQYANHRLAGLNSLKYSVWISRGAGLVLAFDGGLILIPMWRNIIRVVRPKLSRLFPADENIWFHRQVAYSLCVWATVHTTAHYVNFFNVERTREHHSLYLIYRIPLTPSLQRFVKSRPYKFITRRLVVSLVTSCFS
jgi:NADPH oxidase